MILSFRHKGLRLLYERGDASGVSPARAARLEEMLGLLDVATCPRDLHLPGYRLQADLAGFCSLRFSLNWRLTFRVLGADVYDVNLLDYH